MTWIKVSALVTKPDGDAKRWNFSKGEENKGRMLW